MSKHKHTIPITAIIENNGQFLFIKRSRTESNMAGKWVFPGGKIEAGEDAIQALYRELSEETGLCLGNEVAFLSSYCFFRNEDNSSSLGLVFLVKSHNREIKQDQSIEAYKWINPEEIADCKFSFKEIVDFDVETNVTIPGMEVHVRNAIIAIKNNAFMHKDLLSVTQYQQKSCSMNKAYFTHLIEADKLEELVDKREIIFPSSGK